MKPQATQEIYLSLVISYPFSFYVPASNLFGLLNTMFKKTVLFLKIITTLFHNKSGNIKNSQNTNISSIILTKVNFMTRSSKHNCKKTIS